jgi:hypothetical protein
VYVHRNICRQGDSCGTDDGIFIEGEFGDEKDDGRYVSKIRASFKYYK